MRAFVFVVSEIFGIGERRGLSCGDLATLASGPHLLLPAGPAVIEREWTGKVRSRLSRAEGVVPRAVP
jgi:hypothetical protein